MATMEELNRVQHNHPSLPLPVAASISIPTVADFSSLPFAGLVAQWNNNHTELQVQLARCGILEHSVGFAGVGGAVIPSLFASTKHNLHLARYYPWESSVDTIYRFDAGLRYVASYAFVVRGSPGAICVLDMTKTSGRVRTEREFPGDRIKVVETNSFAHDPIEVKENLRLYGDCAHALWHEEQLVVRSQLRGLVHLDALCPLSQAVYLSEKASSVPELIDPGYMHLAWRFAAQDILARVIHSWSDQSQDRTDTLQQTVCSRIAR